MKLLAGKTITIDEFPTHMPYTKNKRAPDRYMKITNQSVYSGTMDRFSRAVLVSNMHDFVISHIPKNFGKFKTPVKMVVEFHVVRNHSTIRRMKKDGSYMWKPADANYEANWDDDNLAFLWIKTIKDAISKYGAWPDDNVEHCRGCDWDTIFVDKLEDMKIVINFLSLL